VSTLGAFVACCKLNKPAVVHMDALPLSDDPTEVDPTERDVIRDPAPG